MRDAIFAYLPSMAMVLAYAIFAAAYRAILGYDPPFGEVTIGALSTIAVGRAAAVTYQSTSIRREEVRVNAANQSGQPQPITTPAVV